MTNGNLPPTHAATVRSNRAKRAAATRKRNALRKRLAAVSPGPELDALLAEIDAAAPSPERQRCVCGYDLAVMPCPYHGYTRPVSA